MEMVNTSLGLVWLLGQTVANGIDWNIWLVGVGIIITLLGIAWKGGLLAGGQANRVDTLNGNMIALEGELHTTKSELHALRVELQNVRDIALVNKTDVQHIMAFKQEFTQTMRSVERELTRRGSNNDR